MKHFGLTMYPGKLSEPFISFLSLFQDLFVSGNTFWCA